MTDKATIDFWKDKLVKMDTYDGDNGELLRRQGQIAFHLYLLQEEYNKLSEKIEYQKRSLWYRVKLAERVMKKFKIKSDIYRSKKATEYWRKHFNKIFKVKPKDTFDDFDINKFFGFLSCLIYKRGFNPIYLELTRKLVEEAKKDVTEKTY